MLRGIGPNLVVALLMDGPQINGRWASRYAAGLADDPGCSVLTVTSLGMAELSRPPGVKLKKSRVVGLWKDAYMGLPVELELPHGYDGLVITLAVHFDKEVTADLRGNDGMASYPRLAGVHPVKVPELLPDLHQDLKKTNWISPYNAFLLARLAQRPNEVSPDKVHVARSPLRKSLAPEELDDLRDGAYRIGREIWRLKPGEAGPSQLDGCVQKLPPLTPEEEERDRAEAETAQAIVKSVRHEQNTSVNLPNATIATVRWVLLAVNILIGLALATAGIAFYWLSLSRASRKPPEPFQLSFPSPSKFVATRAAFPTSGPPPSKTPSSSRAM